MGPKIKDDNIELQALYTPKEPVAPGGKLLNVTLRLRMHNNITVPTDPDRCGAGSTPCEGEGGYCGVIRFFTEQDQFVTNPQCLHIPAPGTSLNIDIVANEITAPTTVGTHTVSSDVAMTASDIISNQISSSITVSEDGAQSVETDPPPANGNGNGDNGDEGKPPLELILEHPVAALGLGLAATVAIRSAFDED